MTRISPVAVFVVLGSLPMWSSSTVHAQKIYWSNACFSPTGETGIFRANLDGSSIEKLAATVDAQGIALDLDANRIYWTDNNVVTRANLDGSGAEALVTTPFVSLQGTAIDPGTQKIYWTDDNDGALQRANLDGSDVEDVFPIGAHHPTGIAFDLQERNMYFSSLCSIYRAPIDSPDPQPVPIYTRIACGGFLGFGAIAFAQDSRRLFWTEFPNNFGDIPPGRVRFSTPTGRFPRTITSFDNGFSNGVAVDEDRSKVYWTGPSGIQRANLNGSGIEDVLTPADGLSCPAAIAVDPRPGS